MSTTELAQPLGLVSSAQLGPADAAGMSLAAWLVKAGLSARK